MTWDIAASRGRGDFVIQWMTKVQGLLGEKMGIDRVFDVDHVDTVSAVADDSQTSGAGTGEYSRDEVRISDPPDEMRPERYCTQRWCW